MANLRKYCFLIFLFCSFSLSLNARSKNPYPPQFSDNNESAGDLAAIKWGFLENQGQWPEEALFRGSASGFSVQFMRDGVAFLSTREAEEEHQQPSDLHVSEEDENDLEEGELQDVYVWKMRFAGAETAPKVVANGVVAARTNFFIGDDPDKWRKKVPEYRELIYEKVWPGIDVRFFLTEGGALKYEFVLAPGADPDQIRIEFEGLDGIEVLESGEMRLDHPWGPVTEDVPVAFTEKGNHDVPVKFRKTGESSYGFEIMGEVPREESWVIDPLILYWSTFAFSSQPGPYYSNDVAYDQTGNLYMTGPVGYAFPSTPGAYQTLYGGAATDSYVAKFSPDGSTLVFMTFLGGSGGDIAHSIVVNDSGRVFICGRSGSLNFPVTLNAFWDNNSTGFGPFAACFSGDGANLIYSTQFCEGCIGNAHGLAAVSNNEVIIAGEYDTDMVPFPTTPGTYLTAPQGLMDGWVLRLNNTGSGLLWSTMLGSSGEDYLYDVAVNDLEEPYVVGYSTGSSFPVTPGAFLTTPGSSTVTRLNANGSGLIYSSWFAPTGELYGVDVHPVSREAFVTGLEDLGGFTTTPGAYQTVSGGATDVVVGRINASGSALIYSTYLGGSGSDEGTGIAVNESGEAYVSGYTNSPNFPITSCQYQTSLGGNRDVFLAHFSPLGNTLGNAGIAIFGGQNNDYIDPRIEVREDGLVDTIFYGATSHSPDFPTTPGTYAPVKGNGTSDLQVAMKLVPVALSIPDTSYCNFDSIEIKIASLFENILWSTSDTTPSIWINQPGQYWVQGSIYGCTYTDTFNISAAFLSVNLGPDTTACDTNGLAIPLNSGAGNAWQWSTSATTSGIIASQPGTYWVEVLDTLTGCRVSDTMSIIPGQVPLINLPPVAGFCQGDSIVLNADPGNNYPGATFNWSNSANTPQTSFQNSGWVWVEVTSTDGCIVRDSSLLSLNQPPNISLGPDTTHCDTTAIVLSANGSGFSSWLWSDGSTGPSATFTQFGTVWVQVTDSNGCSSRDSLDITQGYLPPPDLGSDQALCNGISVSLQADPNNQAPGATWLWHNGSTASQITQQTASWVWVEQTTPAGCVSRDSILITLSSGPNPYLGPDTSVCGPVEIPLDGGTGHTSYLWSNGATTPISTFFNAGWAWVEVTDSNGCSNRDSLLISQIPLPGAFLPSDTLICDVDSLLLNPGPFQSYLWSDGSMAATLTVTLDGSYSVTVSNGVCLDSAVSQIRFMNTPAPNLADDLELCLYESQTVGLQPLPGETVLWSDGSTGWTFLIEDAGDYWVEITNECGIGRDSLKATFSPEFTAPLLPNVFSPNNDGINDCFQIETQLVESYWLQVFDRWGRLMYETQNPNDCWNGFYKGEPAPETVYYAKIRLRACNGELVSQAFSVTLVR